MGNVGSSGGGRRRNSASHSAPPQPQPQSQQEQGEVPPPPPPLPAPSAGNRYIFAAATPYPAQYPNPSPPAYYQYGGYYPPPPPTMPVPLPAPFDHHHRGAGGGDHPFPPPYSLLPHPGLAAAAGGRTSCPVLRAPYVEYQKAITIRNDVNIKKESLRIEPDHENPGKFLVEFTFDANVSGRITVIFFAREGFNCNISPTKENVLPPITVSFKEGLGQKFRQPPGTGIDLLMFEESELLKEGEMEVYPLAIKAESCPSDQEPTGEDEKTNIPNSQITQSVFEKKENGEYQIRVIKQILWANGIRYELREIYGIGNSVDNGVDGNDPGKECVICLSEPRDTTVLPCRHMCMCSGCAKLLSFQTNRCPICRQPVEGLLEIKVNSRAEEMDGQP